MRTKHFALIAALGLVTLAAACGDDGTTTDGGTDTSTPDTGCTGCVDSTGACQAGTADTACGGGGGACAECLPAAGEACIDFVCAAPPACNIDNCDGCCDGDTCIGGLADDLCGASGFVCQDCASTGGTCLMGFCSTACSPETCLTCCDSTNSCVEGASDAQCGRLGAACGACGADETCVASVFDPDDRPIGGTCVDSSCTSTCAGCCAGATCETGDDVTACGVDGAMCTACDAGFTCDAGACVPDPTSRWDILIVRGTVPVTDAAGDPWDSFGGLPDPFVTVTVRDPDTMIENENDTSVQDDTTTPVWNEAVLTAVPARDIMEFFRFVVYDDDLAATTQMGTCDPVSSLLFSGEAITTSCGLTGVDVEISYRLRPN